jgi:O-antigen/teichoic acid export membrane protein
MRAAFVSGSRHVSMVLVPMFIGLAVCAPQIITLFVGARWLPAAPMMAIICVVFAIIASRQLVEVSLTSVAAPHFNLIIQATAISCSLAGLAMGSAYGLLGSTVGWSLRVIPFIVLAAILLRRKLHIGIRAQFAAVAPAFAASAIMAAAVLGLQHFVLKDWPALWSLAASVLTGLVVNGLAAVMIDRNIIADTAALVRPPQPAETA